MIGWESVVRLANPVAMSFDQVIMIAVIGLIANLASAWLLRDDHSHHGHGHRHSHEDGHDLGHPDHDHHRIEIMGEGLDHHHPTH